MLTLAPEGLRSVLFVGAHSDDIEIGCGGAALSLVEAIPGLRVHWTVFSGDGRRHAEARASAARFLAKADSPTIETLDYPDTLFPTRYDALKQELARIRDEARPDLVFIHRREDAHQDHRTLGELAWGAFRDGWILEYEIPKYEGDLGAPNVFVGLSEAVMQAKLDALWDCFESQRTKPWFSKDQIAALALLRGLESRTGERYAEGFYSRKATLRFGSNSAR
ncbi:MAG: PIG-L family deacetylase [Acidobacteria bacterium]|nr:PIG-L family deacetylase [Acidobacteriota bacterium]